MQQDRRQQVQKGKLQVYLRRNAVHLPIDLLLNVKNSSISFFLLHFIHTVRMILRLL